MKRRLLRLVLWGPVLSVAVAGLLLLFSLRLARATLRETMLATQLSAVDPDACRAAPTTWGWRSGDITMFAYDRVGRSANPDAPAIEPDLLRRATTSGRLIQLTTPDRIMWVAPSIGEGPCEVLRGSSRNPEAEVATRFLTVLAAAIVGGMLLAAAGTYWFVVLPLRTRIDGLAVAARAVGRPAFPPPPSSPDALGNIAEVLTQSHVRIVEAREALERRNRALEEHLAGIAHDLRTPLLSMHLSLETVAGAAEGELRTASRRALSDVVYLSSMVENLHQATRLRHDVDVMSGTVDLTDLVRRLEKRFALLGRHAGVKVAATTPEREVWVPCTPALAERAVANLVQNAIEHNTKPGHVAISLVVTNSGGRFELSVVDDGPGLPEATLASLHRETFLADEARPRGPALGLLITKEVARRAKWSVSFEALASTGLQVRLEGAVNPPIAASVRQDRPDQKEGGPETSPDSGRG